METGGNNKVASTVAKAVKEVGLFVEDSDNDDEVEEESRNSAPVNEEADRTILNQVKLIPNKIYQMTLQILLIWNQKLQLRKDHLLKTKKKYCMSNPREND